MSFSAEVKEELSKHTATSRHCQLAELAALIQYGGEIIYSQTGESAILVHTENLSVVRKYFTLLRKTFNIDTDIAEEELKKPARGNTYTGNLDDVSSITKVLKAMKAVDGVKTVSPLLIKNHCCKRALLRGAFLAVGSMSDPAKSYHFELACVSEEQAEQLKGIILGFQIEAKIVKRKKYFVVYVKEGSGIVDLLNIMEAHVALMNLENLRILKEMRNSINRRVNCEAANITKTVNAASKQIEDILYIRDSIGFNHIQDNLRQIAEARLEHPDDTLKELGECVNPPVGKSGVNHRLRRLSELADKLKR